MPFSETDGASAQMRGGAAPFPAPNIQALIDALPPSGGVVNLPAGTFDVPESLRLDRSNVRLVGAGMGQTILRPTGGSSFPALLLSLVGSSADASRKVDAFGKLDASLAPWPGVAWGFATRGECAPAVFGGALQPDKVLTLDLAADLPAAECGLVGYGSYAKPDPYFWSILDPKNGSLPIVLSFRTVDGVLRMLQFGDMAGKAGFHQLSLQIDGSTGKAWAWIDGAETPVVRRSNVPAAAWGSFAPRAMYPLCFGVQGGGGAWTDAMGTGLPKSRRASLAVYGFRASPRLEYDSAPDGTQIKMGGGIPADAWRYTRGNDLGHYDPTDSAAIRIRTPTAASLGLWVEPRDRVTIPPPLDVRVAGMTLRGFSDGAIIGSLYHPTFEDIEVTGGWSGICSAVGLANAYDVRVRRCHLASEVGYLGVGQLVFIDDPVRTDVQTALYRFDGCTAHLRNVIAGETATRAEAVVDIGNWHDYSSEYFIDGIGLDAEVGPAIPLVRCDKLGAGTQLEVRGNFRPGRPGVPHFDLQDMAGGPRPGLLTVYTRGDASAVSIRKQGNWRGTIYGPGGSMIAAMNNL